MFDLGFSEMFVIAVVAIVVIGPKQLPDALVAAGRWIARARGMMRNIRSGFDDMVREAEQQDMEKKWADENARIMREHPEGVPDVSQYEMRELPKPAVDEDASAAPPPPPTPETDKSGSAS